MFDVFMSVFCVLTMEILERATEAALGVRGA